MVFYHFAPSFKKLHRGYTGNGIFLTITQGKGELCQFITTVKIAIFLSIWKKLHARNVKRRFREAKKFRVEVMVNRQRISQVVPKKLKEARDIETALKSGILTGEFFKNSKVNYTLDDVFSQYVNSSVAGGLKSIAKINCYFVKHVKPVMGKHQYSFFT